MGKRPGLETVGFIRAGEGKIRMSSPEEVA